MHIPTICLHFIPVSTVYRALQFASFSALVCSPLLAIFPYHQDVPANVCCSILLFPIIFKLLLFRFITCFYVSVAVPILLQGSSFTAASCSTIICGKQTIYIVNAYPVCKLVHPAHFHAHNVYLHTCTHITIVHFTVYSCEVILYGNVICNTALFYDISSYTCKRFMCVGM